MTLLPEPWHFFCPKIRVTDADKKLGQIVINIIKYGLIITLIKEAKYEESKIHKTHMYRFHRGDVRNLNLPERAGRNQFGRCNTESN